MRYWRHSKLVRRLRSIGTIGTAPARAARRWKHRGDPSRGARHLARWDFDRTDRVTCRSCGWRGRAAGNEEWYRELLDVTCPRCGRMLLIVSYATSKETRAAAAAGHPRAQAELPNVDRHEARLKRAKELALTREAELPDLDGSEIVIDWDFDERDDEVWTVPRHDGNEIWRELAYWEGVERFREVLEILHDGYGPRLVDLRPTPASTLYLYGDHFWLSGTVDRARSTLGR